jgi:hypothetical protein
MAYTCLDYSRRGILKTALKQVAYLTLSNPEFDDALEDRLYSLLDEFSEMEELSVSSYAKTPKCALVTKPELEQDIKTHIVPAKPDENSDSMPTLVCLDRGHQCPWHWWFKDCNECCPRRIGRGTDELEKPDWRSILSSIDKSKLTLCLVR